MASTSYHCSTNPFRSSFFFGSSLVDHGKLQRTRVRPSVFSAKPKFIRCCIQNGDSKKTKNKPLKVVGLGSKRNAILDFCMDSPLGQSSSVEFWTTCSGAPEKIQLFRQMTGNSSLSIEGANGEAMDELLVEHSMSLGSIIVLVAGTGFGSDDKAAIKLLRAIKSNGGLAVSIIMKPFSFEGQRRKKEVDKLIVRLAKFSNLSIVVDSDALLKRETVTLTEALRTANNAVVLAIMSVSALLSDSYMKILHIMPDQSKVVATSDVLNILQHSGRAVVGFGAGYSVKASVEQAAFDCPFLGGGLIQGMKDVVICITASEKIMDRKDMQAAVCAFRHIAKSSAKIICTTVLESTLEPNVIVSTIIITGVESPDATPNLNFWSQFSLRLPFPFAHFWGGLSLKSTDSQATVLPKGISFLEKTLSTSQRTLKKDTQKPPTNALSITTECQDGSSALSSCNKNDNSGLSSKSTASQATVLPKGASFSENTLSAGQRTLKKDTQKPPTNALSISTECQDGSIPFSSCNKNDNGGFKPQLPCINTEFSDITTNTHSSTAINDVVDNHGENIPDLDLAQGTSSNYKSGHIGDPNAYIGAKNQAIQHKLSPSNSSNAIFSPDYVKDTFPRECVEGNMKGSVIASITQNERAANIDESSNSQCMDIAIGLGCQKEDTSGKSNQEMPILDKSTDINIHNSEIAVAHPEGSIPVAQLMDKEELVCWNEELDFSAAEAWAHTQSSLQKNSEVDDRRHPIGIKFVNEKNGNHLYSKFQAGQGTQIEGSQNEIPQDADVFPWNGLADAGLSAMMEIYQAASALVSGNDTEEHRKQRSLSDRAASMLETERGLKRKWSPIIEMRYRDGMYRGRCKGGLPEGKGRLRYKDGSFYDGLWKLGKRCGTGTFYYSSGDMYQGSWREDLMHGKGWFYFKNGDRWFAEFWKGKANGEGRYYSKDGDVFFGHFQNNWRHGKGLYIEPNGTRWYEMWEQGVLVQRTPSESKEKFT